jgi:quercetin dioxygenase-like cupin family protein
MGEDKMFTKKSEEGYRGLVEGVEMKALAHGEKTLLAKFHLKKGAIIPGHQHIHEQTGFMISGKMIFNIGSDQYECEPGDSWCIPGAVEHGVEVLDDSVVIEVFSPVREDYLTVRKA